MLSSADVLHPGLPIGTDSVPIAYYRPDKSDTVSISGKGRSLICFIYKD